VPETGPVLLLGNHISWIDFVFLQWATPRVICFVMHDSYYNWPILRTILHHLDVISVQPSSSRHALSSMVKALEEGRVVCLFPEGHISKDGKLAPLMRGFEKVLNDAKAEVVVVPFAVTNMWGDVLSLAPKSIRKSQKFSFKRELEVRFGECLNSDATRATVVSSIERLLR